MKIMISQPMNGLTDVEIESVRENAISTINKDGHEFVDSYFNDEWVNMEKSGFVKEGVVNALVYFLSKSLYVMSHCDGVYFCKGWEKARGCRIEHEVARAYGLAVIYEE